MDEQPPDQTSNNPLDALEVISFIGALYERFGRANHLSIAFTSGQTEIHLTMTYFETQGDDDE